MDLSRFQYRSSRAVIIPRELSVYMDLRFFLMSAFSKTFMRLMSGFGFARIPRVIGLNFRPINYFLKTTMEALNCPIDSPTEDNQ